VSAHIGLSLPIWFETVVGWQRTPGVCAHIGSPLPWMSRLRRPSGLPPAQTSGTPRPVADGLPPRSLTSGPRRHPARRARGVTRTRLHSLALCRPRLRRKPRPACTRGMDFLLAEKRRCPANRRNVSAERADVGNLPTCVHARWAFWHPRSCTGTSCLRSRPACTHGTRFPTRGRSWPPVNRGDAPTGQDHVRSLVLCVHAGRGFCRWEERHPAPLSFSPSWIFSAS